VRSGDLSHGGVKEWEGSDGHEGHCAETGRKVCISFLLLLS
jgi:hypothetical protein